MRGALIGAGSDTRRRGPALQLLWVTPPAPPAIPPLLKVKLLESAVKKSGDPQTLVRFALALFEARRFGDAAAAFARVDAATWTESGPWTIWAQACLSSDAPQKVAKIVNVARSLSAGQSPRGLSLMSGMALMRQGRSEQARLEFLNEAVCHQHSFAAVEALFKSLVVEGATGGDMLAWSARPSSSVSLDTGRSWIRGACAEP